MPRQAVKLPAGAPIAGASVPPTAETVTEPVAVYRANGAPQQLRLKLGRERKATMTVAEQRATQPERDIRADILAACLVYPRVAWMMRCEPYSGYVLPAGRLEALKTALHKRQAWTTEAVLRELHRALVWREFASAGMADLIGQLRPALAGAIGAVVAFEVKRPGLKTDAHQQAFLDLVARNGGCSAVARDARAAIERIDAFCSR